MNKAMIREIMTEFARVTGLSPVGKAPRRYLWTDAFAVCNFLGLYRQTGDPKYKQLALDLVDQVHNILGRHREDDPRTGWISGLGEKDGKRHPTRGGLRIGKKFDERGRSDPFDEGLEWDRDGQYYHYLTKWMHALDRVSRVTEEPTYNRWAMELAKAAHTGFTYVSRGQKRMYWKMSIDLSYPLVASTGHHDPLDGFITYKQLQGAVPESYEESTWPDLSVEIAEMAGMCEGKRWATDDPLGIGGLLCDAFRLAQLIIDEDLELMNLMEILLEDALLGQESYARNNPLKLPAEHRLAFRELGLSIGLRAVERLRGFIEEDAGIFNKLGGLDSRIGALMRYAPWAETIEAYWLEPGNRQTGIWMEHRDINMVMLATSLNPEGYLGETTRR